MADDLAPYYVEGELRHSYEALFSDFFRNNAGRFESFSQLRNKILISGRGYEINLFVSHVEYVKILEDRVKALLADINVSQEAFLGSCQRCITNGKKPIITLMQTLTEYQDFDCFAEMMEASFNKQVQQQQQRSNSFSPTAASSPKPKSTSRAVRVLWDVENVSVSKKNGFATVQALMKFLVEHDLAGSNIDCRISAFFTMGQVSKSVIVDLDKAAVELVWVATKREDADRKLGLRVMQEMSVLQPESTTIVIISSDQDFRTYLQQLTRAGFEAVVIHDAPEGNWRQALEMHASRSFTWQSVVAGLQANLGRPDGLAVPADDEGPSSLPTIHPLAPATSPSNAALVECMLMTKKVSMFTQDFLPREVLAAAGISLGGIPENSVLIPGRVTQWHGPFGFVSVDLALTAAQAAPLKPKVLVTIVADDASSPRYVVSVRVYVHYSVLRPEQPQTLKKGQAVAVIVEVGEKGPFARGLSTTLQGQDSVVSANP